MDSAVNDAMVRPRCRTRALVPEQRDRACRPWRVGQLPMLAHVRRESRLRSLEHAAARDKWIGCGLISLSSSGPCQAAGGAPVEPCTHGSTIRQPPSAQAVPRSRPCPVSARHGSGAAGARCTTKQRNTHSTESRVIRYRWHPWFDREVWIHRTRVGEALAVARCGHDKPRPWPICHFSHLGPVVLGTSDFPRLSWGDLEWLQRPSSRALRAIDRQSHPYTLRGWQCNAEQ
jgi:hypothetical protein